MSSSSSGVSFHCALPAIHRRIGLITKMRQNDNNRLLFPSPLCSALMADLFSSVTKFDPAKSVRLPGGDGIQYEETLYDIVTRRLLENRKQMLRELFEDGADG